MLASARAVAGHDPSAGRDRFGPVVQVAAGIGGGALGTGAAHLVGRILPVPLVTSGVVSAAVAASLVAAHALAGSPGVGRAGARAVLWCTLVLSLLGQAGHVALGYHHFRRASIARLAAGPAAPVDPALYLDAVLLAETGQPGIRGYLLSTLGVGRGARPPVSSRLRVLGHLVGIGLAAALAARAAQAAVRASRCAGCRRRAERCACERTAMRGAAVLGLSARRATARE